jgi:hypothetical protein
MLPNYDMDLKVGDEVIVYIPFHRREEHYSGTVIKVARKYATIQYRPGDGRFVNEFKVGLSDGIEPCGPNTPGGGVYSRYVLTPSAAVDREIRFTALGVIKDNTKYLSWDRYVTTDQLVRIAAILEEDHE